MNLNAYINPYDPTVLPNNLWISVNPGSIPADGVTNAEILVKLKDKKGRDAPVDGVSINLSVITWKSLRIEPDNGQRKSHCDHHFRYRWNIFDNCNFTGIKSGFKLI